MGSYTGQRRQTSCSSRWIKFALLGVIITVLFQGALCEVEPTEKQCRPYIEKALKEQHLELDERKQEEVVNKELLDEQEEFPPIDEIAHSTEGAITKEIQYDEDDDKYEEEKREDGDDDGNEGAKTEEDDDNDEQEDVKTEDEDDDDEKDEDDKEKKPDELEAESDEDEVKKEDEDKEDDEGLTEDQQTVADEAEEEANSEVKSVTNDEDETEQIQKEEGKAGASEDDDDDDDDDKDSNIENPIDIEIQEIEMDEDDDEDDESDDKDKESDDDKNIQENEKSEEEVGVKDVEDDKDDKEDGDDDDDGTKTDDNENNVKEETNEAEEAEEKKDDDEIAKESVDEKEDEDDAKEEKKDESDVIDVDDEKKSDEVDGDDDDGNGDNDKDDEVEEKTEKKEVKKLRAERAAESEAEEDEDDDQEAPEEEELTKEMVIPENLRPRDHIGKILKLEDSGLETILEKTIDSTLKALKGLYDNAIKPLEMLYKYRDLSNRHFGDPEIFSKPLILFMGPWSGGKSSTINYLLDNEFSQTSLRTGAEPSPAYFNILMHGEEEEIIDGTQLAADWTFSGLQKFGQGLLDRLRGVKLPNKLLEMVNIVEIPGILEIRKQVQRLFPFNDACQWFIDRADIIFLVYDPSKLDVGPETEAILDQLKGREYQTRIILNKADQVKPEELMRVQGTLIWNISPLMSSSEPPIMYSTSLWSLPYEIGAPTRLLQAQERAFLRDLREAIDKRVENKIASARRFAVRVRNHAKMVDCYLTTYYNHKTIFGNRKKISDDIIEYPQKYHIYEGLSTLTNISRYDLPDPDVYRDFFKINPLYEFKKLSETCTYFRGCPINKLDVAIAYDIPELVGKYKKAVETAKEQLQKENS